MWSNEFPQSHGVRTGRFFFVFFSVTGRDCVQSSRGSEGLVVLNGIGWDTNRKKSAEECLSDEVLLQGLTTMCTQKGRCQVIHRASGDSDPRLAQEPARRSVSIYSPVVLCLQYRASPRSCRSTGRTCSRSHDQTGVTASDTFCPFHTDSLSSWIFDDLEVIRPVKTPAQNYKPDSDTPRDSPAASARVALDTVGSPGQKIKM